MSEASRSTEHDEPAEGTIEGDPTRVRGTAARETLVELGDRARAVVEELARHARERREADASRAAEVPPVEAARPADEAVAGLPQRLGEIRAYMGEVADVLEATIERLETVEHQLGDPDQSVERQLADGIARCERVLMGIEHRVDVSLPAERPPAGMRLAAVPDQGPVGSVLVFSRSSRRRAGLCVAVEHHGLQTVAASDFASALRAASRAMPRAALLDLEGTPAERVAVLEEWRDHQERGALPRAAAIGIADARHGFDIVNEEHGAAAMAAVLARLVRGEPDDETDRPRTGE